jgi:truncated hemoglobin YjbI
MKPYRKLFNNSFQRAIAPDAHRFYKRFYEILIAADPQIAELFAKTDVERLIVMLTQSMTHIMSFSATLKPDSGIKKIAQMHGRGKLCIPEKYYDIWLDCMLKTVEEFDPKYDENIEISWQVLMAPGIAYMKSFASGNKKHNDEERRQHKRLIRYLNVIEESTGKLLGYTGDIHYSGLLLVSRSEIPLQVDIPVWIEVPGDAGIKERVPLVINGVWTQMNINPVFYNTGCWIVGPSPNDISKLEKLIEELNL